MELELSYEWLTEIKRYVEKYHETERMKTYPSQFKINTKYDSNETGIVGEFAFALCKNRVKTLTEFLNQRPKFKGDIADFYFVENGITKSLDVKTATTNCETTVIMTKKNFEEHPSDMYVFAHYDPIEAIVRFRGWIRRSEIEDCYIYAKEGLPHPLLKFKPYKDSYIIPVTELHMMK